MTEYWSGDSKREDQAFIEQDYDYGTWVWNKGKGIGSSENWAPVYVHLGGLTFRWGQKGI